eukprot:TRINITY_DN8314_c0_g1_i2.p1 TRINITY_DN8314_c0_g1~~TRINITY_DN8314_c0_g1_i2.p1  ORF type:complete len:188 (-),score=20.02 TRINITY_DN8314_c0_g1_i2:109-672(-)
MYKNYQKFNTLLRIDLLAIILLVLMIGVEYFDGKALFKDVEFTLTIVLVVINSFWALLGYVAVKKENKILLILFVLIALIIPGYIIAELANIREVLHQNKVLFFLLPIIITGIFVVITRIGLFYFSYRAWKYFGHGLKERVFDADNSHFDTSFSSEVATPIFSRDDISSYSSIQSDKLNSSLDKSQN